VGRRVGEQALFIHHVGQCATDVGYVTKITILHKYLSL
jgi:hypothetical protein